MRIGSPGVNTQTINTQHIEGEFAGAKRPEVSPKQAWKSQSQHALKSITEMLGKQRGDGRALQAKRGEATDDFAKIGIIGGMGPAAGNAAAERLVDIFQKEFGVSSDQAHGAYVLTSNSPQIGDRTAYAKDNLPPDLGTRSREERVAMLTDPREDNPFHGMRQSIDEAAAAGAKIAAITCNTAHIWFDALEDHAAAKGVKLLHIADSVAEAVAKSLDNAGERRHPVKIGQLATNGTNSTGLYQNRLTQKYPGKFAFELPQGEDQQQVMAGIYGTEKFPVKDGRESKGVKGGEYAVAKDLMRGPADKVVAKGAEVVTGACTEVPLVLSQKDFDEKKVLFVDTLRSLMSLAATEAKKMGDAAKAATHAELTASMRQVSPVQASATAG